MNFAKTIKDDSLHARLETKADFKDLSESTKAGFIAVEVAAEKARLETKSGFIAVDVAAEKARLETKSDFKDLREDIKASRWL